MSKKMIFVEEARDLGNTKWDFNTSRDGYGMLVNLSDYANKGNVWNVNNFEFEIIGCYSEEFNVNYESNSSIIYEADNGDGSTSFYVMNKEEFTPFTCCYRFENYDDAIRKYNELEG